MEGLDADERERVGALVVSRCITDIARTYQLTPEDIWYRRSRGQMLILWRSVQESESRALGHNAIVTHAATAAAIINTIAGKETPDFKEMVDSLMGVKRAAQSAGAPTMADQKALDGLGIVPTGESPLDQMKEF